MSNFFLLNGAIELDDYEDFTYGMSELLVIERDANDIFLKHVSLYSLNVINRLFNQFGGQTELAIYKFIEQSFQDSSELISSEVVFDGLYPDQFNGFLGIDFTDCNISSGKCFENADSYKAFKFSSLWEVSFVNLWSKRDHLFPNLVLCGDVEDQIHTAGRSSKFNQIIVKLSEFDKAVKNWVNGEFNYRDINREYALRISPESDQTMAKFGNQRIFSLPNGGTAVFELHIKTGDLRFHFFPDNHNRKVYVGYIGSHLNTVSG